MFSWTWKYTPHRYIGRRHSRRRLAEALAGATAEILSIYERHRPPEGNEPYLLPQQDRNIAIYSKTNSKLFGDKLQSI